ncbi:hypothetical protein DYB25_004353 [Aphanomyces astaci]|uniref:Uncharacterized protein n=3 Tax=Aphanomyces astaci TaxID=112090 RepID=A0A397B7S6_APHAT|nr:hypothetical protein DYB25_004353 [Aphanomyces astaci]RHY16217.1 hypothetical protein DYB36_005251 [Aphanomyces astaci]RHY53142.1 hypothetical protein DYB38_004927 [Aphanomyces astaci]RHY60570.1 hypothetical protein DYB34_005012 [Aphanomyces astaci]RQM28217.1 hypothetical protein B5M09_007344 [Aphanomyces astaci]
MIKSTVGHVKRPAYDLPDARETEHVYGYPIIRDPEDAGQVMGKWVQATPSPAVESTRSFVETNRRALQIGCINAKDVRQYANEHPDIREKAAPTKKQIGYTPTNDVIYGIKTAYVAFTTRASEDIQMLIQAKHTNFHTDGHDYPDLSGMKIKGKLPLPRETKASISQDKRLQLFSQPPEKELFKMSKFKKIGSMLATQPVYGSPSCDPSPQYMGNDDDSSPQQQATDN